MKSERRLPLIILFSCVATGMATAVYLYHVDNLALLYYSDSVSHLVRARQLADSSSPGLEQIGTVWLPLPHIILLPFSLVEVLLKTGFAGTAVSLPCIAISAAILYKMIEAQTRTPWIAFLGACLYFSNANVLYLGLTAMTEALFMLFFVISAFYFQKYSFIDPLFSEGRRYVAFTSNNQFDLTVEAKRRTLVLKPLLKCCFFVTLASLCRYEAWPIVVFLILFGLVHLTGRKDPDRTEILIPPRALMKLRSGFLLCTLVSTSGIIVWISYNSIYYANPVEFVVSPYYSAISQAIEGQTSKALFLQPLNVAYIYGTAALAFFGPAMTLGAIVGYALHRKSALKAERRGRGLLFVFLAVPSITILLALLIGIGEMNERWFNSRFVITLSPLLILLASILIKKMVDAPFGNKTVLAYLISAIFLIYPIIVVPLYGVFVVFVDAKNSLYYGTRPSAMEMVESLKGLYNGGKILIVTGSAQQNIIMQASGIPLKNFQTAIEGSHTPYEIHRPALDSQYVILSKNPDSSSKRYAESWTDSQDKLRGYFVKAYENSHYLIFVRSVD